MDIVEFVFTEVYDTDHNGVMSTEEFHRIAECAYGVPFGHNSRVDGLLTRADSDGNDRMSYDEYITFAKKNQQVTYPAYNVRVALAERIGGVSFWKKASSGRQVMYGKKSCHDILKEGGI